MSSPLKTPQPEAPEPPRGHSKRWINSLLVMFITSVVLLLILQALTFLGAKALVDGIANDTASALKNLGPLEMAHRYMGQLDEVWFGPCNSLINSVEFQKCYANHPINSGPLAMSDLAQALLGLVKSIFSESFTHSVIDFMQLFLGFSISLFMVFRFSWLYHPLFWPMFVIILGIALTCLMSIPLLAVLWLVSRAMQYILPEALSSASLSAVGGVWGGLLCMCSGRTVEAGLHHLLSGVVNRIITRR